MTQNQLLSIDSEEFAAFLQSYSNPNEQAKKRCLSQVMQRLQVSGLDELTTEDRREAISDFLGEFSTTADVGHVEQMISALGDVYVFLLMHKHKCTNKFDNQFDSYGETTEHWKKHSLRQLRASKRGNANESRTDPRQPPRAAHVCAAASDSAAAAPSADIVQFVAFLRGFDCLLPERTAQQMKLHLMQIMETLSISTLELVIVEERRDAICAFLVNLSQTGGLGSLGHAVNALDKVGALLSMRHRQRLADAGLLEHLKPFRDSVRNWIESSLPHLRAEQRAAVVADAENRMTENPSVRAEAAGSAKSEQPPPEFVDVIQFGVDLRSFDGGLIGEEAAADSAARVSRLMRALGVATFGDLIELEFHDVCGFLHSLSGRDTTATALALRSVGEFLGRRPRQRLADVRNPHLLEAFMLMVWWCKGLARSAVLYDKRHGGDQTRPDAQNPALSPDVKPKVPKVEVKDEAVKEEPPDN